MLTTILMRVRAADLGEGFLCSDTLDEMKAVFFLFFLIFFQISISHFDAPVNVM